MSTDSNTARLVGAAFVFQAVTSLVSGLLLQSLVVSGDIGATMANFASHTLVVRASIVGEMLTAVGIVTLGALLYDVLRKQSERIALVALVLYALEAGLLATSRIALFALMRASQAAELTGATAYLGTLGTLLEDAQNFGYTLLMLAFAIGATLFYSLLVRSRLVPQWLSIFGLVAALLALFGILLELFGVAMPMIVFLPNLPFEVGIGVWLLVRGFSWPATAPEPATTAYSPAPVT